MTETRLICDGCGREGQDMFKGFCEKPTDGGCLRYYRANVVIKITDEHNDPFLYDEPAPLDLCETCWGHVQTVIDAMRKEHDADAAGVGSSKGGDVQAKRWSVPDQMSRTRRSQPQSGDQGKG